MYCKHYIPSVAKASTGLPLNALSPSLMSLVQLLVILIGKLLKSGILECSSVANWLFSKENSGEFMKSYTWEILNQTIQKSIKNVESLEKELEESKTKRRKVRNK